MPPRTVPMDAGRTLVMGILNVTPDSFSDGGEFLDVDAAVARGYAMIRDGADIIDVGGESTRPGARPLTASEEWDRIGAVVRALAQTAMPISVDTYHAQTARNAVEAGAALVNDVTGGAGDPAMLSTVASLGCAYVLQHTRGTPETMNSLASYENVSHDVAAELRAVINRAVALGISRNRIIVDPGFGFAKNSAQNWDLAAHMEEVEALGQPLLVGVSRKRFLADVAPDPKDPKERDDATAALTAYFAGRGVWAVRVHEVAASKAAVMTVKRLRDAGGYA
ncbi:MAG: dihydropteroate synthase [Ancrocorticia sp.]|nr:dihydropteroate synthase [Ancrocorticia sp.]MCI1962756.1 dihydropteroate synthase [Ancrocorticia sp.]MCI2001964.1 dihydropteroate synthase [Ancrocorticia sp.]MCI2012397.1 dihydropteroate synthase [Ancrocorticia sp.]MCI2029181.1 dihydropteroate synthase [Ancrocorticia sp.]